MNLISIQFAVFFTTVFFIYWLLQYIPLNQIIKNTLRKVFLLFVNLVFCYLGGIKTVFYVFLTVLITWSGGMILTRRKNKGILLFFVLMDLLPLIILKYGKLMLETVGLETTGLFIPLGISFYTLQSITYIVSIYRNELECQSPLTMAVFVSFFPIISSGPIARAKLLIPQMNEKVVFEYDRAANGMLKIGCGLLKKLVVANTIGLFVDRVYNSLDSVNAVVLILAVLLYSFQIYYDFSGYSDMAVGLSQLLGFDITENFNKPYLSKSIGEFWRRWHISLSSWFRDYVYIPLGGNRVTLFRQYCNVIIVFVLSGLWHGASWHFAVWGLIHGVIICLERLICSKTDIHLPKVVRVIYAFLVSTFAWIFFRSESTGQALQVLEKSFSLSFSSFLQLRIDSLLLRKAELPQFYIAMGVMLTLIMIDIHLRNSKDELPEFLRRKPLILRWCVYFCIVFTVLFFSVKLASPNFIYTGF